jgi:hypothetical protein
MKERPFALASMRDGSAALIHRKYESDKAHPAPEIKIEEPQVKVQAGKQRSSALGKRRVRAGSSSLVDETLVGAKRSRDGVHDSKRTNLLGQRGNSAVLRTVKRKQYRKPCEVDGCKSAMQSKRLVV